MALTVPGQKRHLDAPINAGFHLNRTKRRLHPALAPSLQKLRIVNARASNNRIFHEVITPCSALIDSIEPCRRPA